MHGGDFRLGKPQTRAKYIYFTLGSNEAVASNMLQLLTWYVSMGQNWQKNTSDDSWKNLTPWKKAARVGCKRKEDLCPHTGS